MRKLLTLLLAVCLILAPVASVFSACDIIFYQVLIEPMTAGAQACYTITFTTSCVVPKGEYVNFTFPLGTSLQIGYGNYPWFENRPDRFTAHDNVLTIQLTSDLPPTRHILKLCGVKNPYKTGPHVIIISTSTGSYLSPEFSFNATSVSQPEVIVNPDYVNACAEYIIRFRASSDSGKGCGCHKETTLEVIFPPDTTMPNLDFGAITVNGYAVSGAYISSSDRNLRIIITSTVNAGDYIEIKITSKGGIRNPSKPGWYSLKMWTSADTVPIWSKPYYIRPSAVSRAVITLDTPYTCSVSGVRIKFKTGPNGQLQTGQKVNIVFGEGFQVPRSIAEDNIAVNDTKIKGQTAVSSYDKKSTISIASPVRLPADSEVEIVVLPGAGIVLPDEAGSEYFVLVETSSEPVEVPSFPFAVLHSRITSVDYQVAPAIVTLPASHTIVFKTGGCGDMTPGLDTFSISFSKEFMMPKQFVCDGITVNGTTLKNIPFLEDHTVTFSPPQLLAGNSFVTVFIPEQCGIKNPGKAGVFHHVTVWSSREPDKMISGLVVLATTQLSNVSLQLGRHLVSQRTSAKLSFTLGKAGSLRNGSQVKVTLGQSFDFSGRVTLRNFTCDGVAVRGVTWKKPDLTFICPKDYPSLSKVTIEFDEDAGLRTPDAPGFYSVFVSTDPEPEPIKSFDIPVAQPPDVLFQTLPLSPDGRNDWFVTKPKVSILAGNVLDTSPQVEINLDGQIFKYEGPFDIPDGVHLMVATATDKFGNISKKASFEVKVDTIPPQFDPPSGKVYTRARSHRESLNIYDDNQVEASYNDTLGVNVTQSQQRFYWIEFASNEEKTIEFEFKVTDEAGNVGVWEREVCFDWSPPTLEVPDKMVTELPRIIIKGTTEPAASGVLVTLDGAAVKVADDGGFEVDYSPKNGRTVLTFKATDPAGNVNTKLLQLTANLVKTVILTIGSKEAFSSGKVVQLQAAPYLWDGVTMVPMRFICEALGAKVDYNAADKAIKISLGKQVVELVLGNHNALVNGKIKELTKPPVIKGGVTFIPLRFLTEALGAWIEVSGKKITISYIITDDVASALRFGPSFVSILVRPVCEVLRLADICHEELLATQV